MIDAALVRHLRKMMKGGSYHWVDSVNLTDIAVQDREGRTHKPNDERVESTRAR